VALLAPDLRILAASPEAWEILGRKEEGLLPLDAFAEPEDREQLRGAAAQAALGGVATVVILLPRGEARQPLEVELRPALDGAPGYTVALLYVHSAAYRREQLILAFNRLAPQLLHAASPRAVYHEVGDTMRGLGYGMGVFEIAGAGLRLAYDTAAQAVHDLLLEDEPAAVTGDIPLSAPILGEVIVTQRALYHPDARELLDALYPPDAVRHILASQQITGLRGYIYAPLVVDEGVRGILSVWGPHLDHPDLPFIEAFAHQIGAALGQIRLRQAMERQIQQTDEARRYLDTIIQNVPDALLIIQADMTLKPLNTTPAHTFGYDVAELEGRSFLDFVPEDKREEALGRWHKALTGQPQRFEIELLRITGSRYSAQISLNTVPGYGALLATVRDTTELRKLEARIRQSDKLAALGRLVGGAAHELNNPLAVIVGLAQLQLQEDLPPDTRADIAAMEQAARRAAAIVQQLRLFARPQELHPRPIDLAVTTGEVLSRLSREIAALGINTALTFPDEPLLADSDPYQIEQALFNILQNTAQALATIPAGKPRTIQVRGWREGTSARLSIADSGPGVRPEHMPQIFEPFFTTRPVGQGIGLGLALVYAIVQQHGGDVWAESELGRGTAIEIRLPASAS
jgi:PAS domain S-box-containing protein